MYILQSVQNGRYYIGSTSNVTERLLKHNAGSVISTKGYRPWEVKYTEGYRTLSEARKREYQIKSWKKRVAIEKLIKHFNS